MGTLRRRIEIATGPGVARAVVEDDFHHFRVVLRHADGRITAAASEALRFPTALCPMAGEQLSKLVGMALDASSVAVMTHTDPRQQCTHVIDLAGLAVAAAARGTPRRSYEAAVPDRDADERTQASLRRDGVEVLAWDVAGQTIEGPEPYAGLALGGGFTGWAREHLPAETAEAALVLRRAVFISGGRRVAHDADSWPNPPIGGCWAWQAERADRAVRMPGSVQDFTDRPEALTAEDREWLAG